ncbi:MAG: hypothetical protein FWD67_01080 [Betaproteobacteria bacterium]|nr:hypothetical protein [Betaproteobacteria bacterium]
MNMKQTYFSRFILLIVICSFLSLTSGCCSLFSQVCEPQTQTGKIVNPTYAKQAKELAAPTGKLTVAIQGIIEYSTLSYGMSDEQILRYIYTEKPELGLIFSNKKVIFTRIDKYVEVTVYADNQTTILIIDNSSTPTIDFIYGND